MLAMQRVPVLSRACHYRWRVSIRSDQGIVLRSYPFGEADRVVVLLSPNRGKLRTVAKGVRKTKSRFGGRLEPFTHVDLIVYEGRNLDTITQVAVIEAFPFMRSDLDRVMAAGTMVEAIDAVAQEGQNSTRLFLLVAARAQSPGRRGRWSRSGECVSLEAGRGGGSGARSHQVRLLRRHRHPRSVQLLRGRSGLLGLPVRGDRPSSSRPHRPIWPAWRQPISPCSLRPTRPWPGKRWE